jgi:D-inositol-3-phosphate glycosyltransferase
VALGRNSLEMGLRVDARVEEIETRTPDSALHNVSVCMNSKIEVVLLTGGADKDYAFGLGTALMAKGAGMDLIGNDELDCPVFRGQLGVNFLNLRGDQRSDVSFLRKAFRVAGYYVRLILYATKAQPQIFHVLWNNKFEAFDRTLLTLYYKWLGKKIVLTAHNVNARIRDANDTALNRLTLRIQYRLADHIFVHTDKMKKELMDLAGLTADRITVIPFGMNNAIPNTNLTTEEARQRLGIRKGQKVLLFFGYIAPYKGVEYLIGAFRQVLARDERYRLIIAGRPKNCLKYWGPIRQGLRGDVEAGRVLLRTDYIPDDETEVYFKAADAFVLPYRHIYQSGVLFLGHGFGLPVLAADVGSLRDDIVEGQNGFIFRPEDPDDLARAIEGYFGSDLYASLDLQRQQIRASAEERHSWGLVAQLTMSVYARLLQIPCPTGATPIAPTVPKLPGSEGTRSAIL